MCLGFLKRCVFFRMSNNGTFEIQPSTDSPPSRKMTDREPLINRSDPMQDGFFNGIVRPCFAEFFGVTLFVFIGTMSVLGSNAALAHGLALAVLVAATAKVSGGHLNPAVTLGIYLSGGIDTLKAIAYFVSQIIGGIVGAAITRGALQHKVYMSINGGGHTLGDGVAPGEGILLEIFITAILVTVVLMTAVDSESKITVAPLLIGFSLTADILAAGSISGGSANPARSFGPAVVFSTFSSRLWPYHYIYWVGPAVGAVLSSICYRLFLGSPEKRFLPYR